MPSFVLISHTHHSHMCEAGLFSSQRLSSPTFVSDLVLVTSCTQRLIQH
jgi:hypothetical protein